MPSVRLLLVTMKTLVTLALSSLLLVASVATNVANTSRVSQKFSSGIAGRITDPNGAVIVGAKITIVSRASHASVSRRTNTEGAYMVDLGPDVNDVDAEANGFKKATRKSIPVAREGCSYVDFVLQPTEPVMLKLIN